VNRNTLRLIVILATLCIVGIAVTQVYWVRRAFDLKEEALNRELNSALFTVAQQIFNINNVPAPVANPVKQLSTNYFVVMVNGEIDVNLLELLLRQEFEKRNLKLDFEYGIYNCLSEEMVYGNYIAMELASKEEKGNLPKWKDETYYFGVQFPTREAHLVNQMGIWSFSTLVLLLVMVFFAYTLFIIFKQKRLGEIQKDFINNMTHEFKTPLSTIAISAQVIKDPDTVHHPDRLLNYATIIQNENNKLRQQVDRVLQAARHNKDDLGLKKEWLDVNALVHEAVSNFELALNEKNGGIQIKGTTSVQIQADKLHLINAISNVLDNAIKYCDQSPQIIISIKERVVTTTPGITFAFWRKNMNVVQIIVEDNGLGIAKENQKRIFQQFYRVPTGNIHNVKGFGIGLHYVKLIVDAHNGSVQVVSEPGKGSKFIISIPVA
jgi:two-component system phosphate regulon sensor histidine kinase PhoR